MPEPYYSNPLAYGAAKDPLQDRNACMASLLPIHNLLCVTVADITVSENKLCSIFIVNAIKNFPRYDKRGCSTQLQ